MDIMMKSGIYLIKINDKIYIGSSANISKRWREHKTDLIAGRHKNMFLQRTWNKGLKRKQEIDGE